jgi:hypothetical protein
MTQGVIRVLFPAADIAAPVVAAIAVATAAVTTHPHNVIVVRKAKAISIND